MENEVLRVDGDGPDRRCRSLAEVGGADPEIVAYFETERWSGLTS